MTTLIETLTGTIDRTKNLSEVQNQSIKAQYGDRMGYIIAEWSVEAEMARLGVAALPAGTYYPLIANMVVANANNHQVDHLFVPKGAILLAVPMVHQHKAKAGSGTITPYVGSLAFGAVSSLMTAGLPDDAAGNVLVAGYQFASAMDISFVVASNTVTAGSTTILFQYLLSNAV